MAVLLPTQPAASSQGCVALRRLLGLATSAQSSLHIVTKVVLRRSEPSLLLDTLTQAQDIAELSFGSFVIYTCLFFTVSFRSLYTKAVFPKSPDTAPVRAAACLTNVGDT